MNESKQGKLPAQTDPTPLYPSALTFVIRVPRDTDPAALRLHGRVEHILSSSGREFAGTEDLLEFIRAVLASER